jgi:hypothetical protein
MSMNRDEIIARLRENEAALRQRGVAHAALFGSRARGEQGTDSDTDIMIEIDPDAPVGVWEYAGIKTYIASHYCPAKLFPSRGNHDISDV